MDSHLYNTRACRMRNKLVLLLSLSLIIGLGACTSKKVDQGDTDADAAEMTGDSTGGSSDTAGLDGAKTENSSADISDDFGTDDSTKKDAAPADSSAPANGNADAAAAPPAGNDDLAGLDDSTAQPPPPPADNKDSQQLATNDSAPAPTTDAAAVPPPSDAAAPPSSDETQGLSGAMGAPADSKPVIPLQKMVTAPFTKKGIIANALYVARPGDTLKTVSDKIYGQDKVADLKKINTAVAHRALRVGDKIYYNSPQRPTDNTQMLTYYEDKGLAPEVYLAQSGDNLHAVGKKLLGDKNSWKELWVTNPDVESKSDLTEGTRLRYWSNETAPTVPVADNPANLPPPGQNVAANAPPPAQGQVGAPPPMPEQAPPPPPPGGQPPAVNAAPPPPPPPVADSAPPPPPPTMANNTPPPPPKKMAKPGGVDKDKDAGGILGDDPDQMMALGVGVILLLAAAALVIIIRKKRAKRAVDFQTASHTQIE
jgi:hypothetical protein